MRARKIVRSIVVAVLPVALVVIQVPALGALAAPTATTIQHPAVQRPLATAQQKQAARASAATRATPVAAKAPVNIKGGKTRIATRGGGLQCVPFARNASGIAVSGNAHLWWDNAAGVYERGSAPEAGSILSFRANQAMRLGHVAVVTQVINARQIEIDHANWGFRRGGISRGVVVVDVSNNNDWTAVRVALGHDGEFGSIYPTNGFIYDRPDRGGSVMAAVQTPEAAPDLNPAPRDLRPVAERNTGYASATYADGLEEVAEAPAPTRKATPTRRRTQRLHH
jgi:surface antigen